MPNTTLYTVRASLREFVQRNDLEMSRLGGGVILWVRGTNAHYCHPK